MSMGTKVATVVECPDCNGQGKSVQPLTLQALLKAELSTDVANLDYRFCSGIDCDVVYYGNGQTFSKSQLKVPVGVKEKTGERPLCYCFGHSVASIKDELRSKGRSSALEEIRRNMKAPGCWCETANPSGSCCLGSVAKGIGIAQKELGVSDVGVASPESPAKSSSHRGEIIAKVGTVVSAIMASSCCWLPLLLLAAGVSGAGITSTLESYRPLLMLVTFSFLAAAFYFTYRPRKSAAGSKHDCCAAVEVEDGCSSTTKRRFHWIAMNKIALWGVTIMAIAFLLFPNYVGALLGSDGSTVTANMNRSVFAIEGMTCEGCSAIAVKAIRGVPGVLAVEVNYEEGQAIVGTEEGSEIPIDAVLRAIEEAGYTGSISPIRPTRDNE